MSKAKGHTVVPKSHNLLSVANTQRPGHLTNQLQYLENEVLEELWNHEYSGPFQVLVDPVSLPVYYDVIKDPMDLSTIKMRLRNQYYKNALECIQDFLAIFINCFTFYKPKDEILLKAKTLQEIFLKRISKMPKGECDITSKQIVEWQNRTEVSKFQRSHMPEGFERRTSEIKEGGDKNKTPSCDSLDSSSSVSNVTFGKSSSFCEPHYLTHEQSTLPKKMRTESQQANTEIVLTELEEQQEEMTFPILRCGVEVSTPPDKHTAIERERLKMEAQIRRRMEADLNGFDLTLQSNLMADFEEKYIQ